MSLFEAANKEADSRESQLFVINQYWTNRLVAQPAVRGFGIFSPEILVRSSGRTAMLKRKAKKVSSIGMKYLAALREQSMNPLCLFRTIQRK